MLPEDKQTRKFGVKIQVITTMDYVDYREICDAVEKLGYQITIVDNGMAVAEKLENPI
jgi:hypothetical protein